jgi:exopolysaccharide production protein ExoZ
MQDFLSADAVVIRHKSTATRIDPVGHSGSTSSHASPDGFGPLHAPATYQSIQVLRAAAALMVVLFHAGLRIDSSETLFRVGNAGVDLFFVISGFVMWTVTSRRPTAPATFLWHRAIRLVPLYWLMTLLTVAAYGAAPALFPHMRLNLPHVLLSLGFIPHVTVDGRNEPVLGQGWTLNYEVYFYLLFAATLTLPARWRLGAITAALLALALAGTLLTDTTELTDLLTNPLLLEFLGGIGIGWLAAGGWRRRMIWRPSFGFWGCIALGIGGLCVLPAPASGDDLARLPLYGGPAVLIVAGCVGIEITRGLRLGRVPMLLGAASYSIYLTHTFVISMIGKFWSSRIASMALPPAAAVPVSFMILCTTGAAVVGIAVYLLVERPLLGWLRGALPGRGRPQPRPA